jgi:hypothetical protein
MTVAYSGEWWLQRKRESVNLGILYGLVYTFGKEKVNGEKYKSGETKRESVN